MKHQNNEVRGLVLFSRDHREKDKLVKIFTESYGKIMFFAKRIHQPNNPLQAAILPFTEACYLGEIRSEGLSFLNAAKEVHSFRHIQADIFISAYATYILGLVDAAIPDQEYDPALYGFCRDALRLMDNGRDAEVVTNIFEIQLLKRFGAAPQWQHCCVCGKTEGKFDFSPKYGGVLCQEHWYKDEHRYHASPRAIYFIRLFAAISYQQIESIKLKPATKKEIRQVIDQLYADYVGLHLKSKKFIDQMDSWKDILASPEDK